MSSNFDPLELLLSKVTFTKEDLEAIYEQGFRDGKASVYAPHMQTVPVSRELYAELIRRI